jgi:hypothetical protein
LIAFRGQSQTNFAIIGTEALFLLSIILLIHAQKSEHFLRVLLDYCAISVFLKDVRATTQSWDPVVDAPVDEYGSQFIGDYQGLAVDDHFVHPFGTTHGLGLKKSSRRLFRARRQRFLDKLIYVQYTLLKLSNSTLLALMNFNYYIGMACEGRSIDDVHDKSAPTEIMMIL